MKYQVFSNASERVIGYDSLLDALEANNILQIEKIDPTGNSTYFSVVEANTNYYYLTLTRSELKALGEEIIALSES